MALIRMTSISFKPTLIRRQLKPRRLRPLWKERGKRQKRQLFKDLGSRRRPRKQLRKKKYVLNKKQLRDKCLKKRPRG